MRLNLLKQKKFWLFLLLVVFITAYHLTPFGQTLSLARAALIFSGSSFYRAGREFGAWWHGLTHSRELGQELARSRERILELEDARARASALATENESLRALWNFKEEAGYDLLPATVLGFFSLAGRSTIVVNRGSESGVGPGMAVVIAPGVLVGKVVSVTTRTATVELIFSGQSAVAATVAGQSEVPAIVRGKTGLGLSLELIPQDSPLGAGDMVVSSTLEEGVPAGLLLGKIAAVFYREGELFKRATLEPLFSVAQLDTVAVVRLSL